MESFSETLLTRRSIRTFTGEAISSDQLESILLAGIHAPSAHDSRPWHIVAVVSSEGKQQLREALAVRLIHDMTAAGFSPEEISCKCDQSQASFRTAGALLVVCAKASTPYNPLASSTAIEQLLTAQSVALCAGQMLLAAHQLGLGACWFAAPLFCPGQVIQACALDGTRWQPQCLLAVGHPAQLPKIKDIPQLAQYVVYR